MPKAEVTLWCHLKSSQLKGCKFRRQHSIGNYVVDFYCPKLKLTIELDGESHYSTGSNENDRIRQEYIEKLGIKVLRFTNFDVYGDLEGVLKKIEDYLYHPLCP